MKTENKILEVEEIYLDEKLYPRENYDNEIIKKYATAMRKGDTFPAIVVARVNNKYFLVDGKHRLEAYKKNKSYSSKCFIDCEVLLGLNDKEIYLESVKRNLSHGVPFYDRDIEKIKTTLQEFKLSREEISDIIRVPANEIKRISFINISRIGANTNKVKKGIDYFESTSNEPTHSSTEISYTDNRNKNILDGFLESLEKFNDECRDFKLQFDTIEDDFKKEEFSKLKRPLFRNLRNVLSLLAVSQRFIRYREELLEIKKEIETIVREIDENKSKNKVTKKVQISAEEVPNSFLTDEERNILNQTRGYDYDEYA